MSVRLRSWTSCEYSDLDGKQGWSRKLHLIHERMAEMLFLIRHQIRKYIPSWWYHFRLPMQMLYEILLSKTFTILASSAPQLNKYRVFLNAIPCILPKYPRTP